jgi:hypothetical protein
MSFIYCRLNFHANLQLRPWRFPLMFGNLKKKKYHTVKIVLNLIKNRRNRGKIDTPNNMSAL